MKIIFVSDTHGEHRKIELPQGDMIIHAGDISRRGRVDEVEEFLDWFVALNYKHKVFIAGNHDFYFEGKPTKLIQDILPSGVHYLCDSGIEIEGLHIYGSPITPFFYNWAFNRHRGDEIKQYWDLIPCRTDILVTHGPACGILDKTAGGDNAGCEELLSAISRVKPKFHLFGHIHEGYGTLKTDETTFVNGSSLDENYAPTHAPIVLEI